MSRRQSSPEVQQALDALASVLWHQVLRQEWARILRELQAEREAKARAPVARVKLIRRPTPPTPEAPPT